MDLINFLDIVNDDENEIDDLVRMNRQLVYRCNPFERYNDLEFYGRYRFSKAATRHLIDIMRNDFERATQRHNALLPEEQVIIFKIIYLKKIVHRMIL